MTTSSDPAVPPPDDKDWTSVIVEGCAECGFVPSDDAQATGATLRAMVPRWDEALQRPHAADRPAPTTWSIVEYACHVRDVCALFRDRLVLMLDEDDARFANWDQDATAIEQRYWEQDPAVVAHELAAEVAATAALFDTVHGDQWERRGTRSNGSVFTVRTFATYFLHDVAHHLVDVDA